MLISGMARERNTAFSSTSPNGRYGLSPEFLYVLAI
jgi:hypothetical protein